MPNARDFKLASDDPYVLLQNVLDATADALCDEGLTEHVAGLETALTAMLSIEEPKSAGNIVEEMLES